MELLQKMVQLYVRVKLTPMKDNVKISEKNISRINLHEHLLEFEMQHQQNHQW